jgi:glycerol-3-phosphate dehydrogenase
VGDLYVSAAGGRNSKMGSYLGKGLLLNQLKKDLCQMTL